MMVMLRQLSFIELGLDKGLDLDFSHFILTVALWVTVLFVQMMLLGNV